MQIRSESDPNPNPIRSDRIRSDFGTKILISDRIGLEKLFRSRIGSDRISSLDVDHFFRLSFFYVFLVLYLIWLNIFTSTDWIEKFILLKDSSDRIGILYQNSDRIGFGSENFGSDRIRILNISQLSDWKRPIRSVAYLYCQRCQVRDFIPRSRDFLKQMGFFWDFFFRKSISGFLGDFWEPNVQT